MHSTKQNFYLKIIALKALRFWNKKNTLFFFTSLARRLDDHFPPGSIGSFLPAQPALHSIGLSFFFCQHFFGFYFFIEVNIYLISYSSRLTRCIFLYAACMTPVSNSVTSRKTINSQQMGYKEHFNF